MEGPEDPGDISPKTNAELREIATSKMIQTAIHLIARNGAAKLSLVDVGREAGYSHSLPNYYFKTKQKLLLEVNAFIAVHFRKRVDAWALEHMPQPIKPGLASIEATLRGYLTMVRVDPERSRVMNVIWAEAFSSMPGLLVDVRPLNARALRYFEGELRNAIANGEIDPAANTRAIAMTIVSTLRGAASQYLIDPDCVDLTLVGDTVMGMLQNVATPVPPPAAASSSTKARRPARA